MPFLSAFLDVANIADSHMLSWDQFQIPRQSTSTSISTASSTSSYSAFPTAFEAQAQAPGLPQDDFIGRKHLVSKQASE